MRGYTTADKISYWFFSDRMPLTKILIVANALALLIFSVFLKGLDGLFIFDPQILPVMPWTLLTYPFIGRDIISVLFSGYWLWFAGGSLERSWGTRKFTIYFFSLAAISAIGLYLGYLVTGANVSLLGLWLPLAGVTISFAMLNPEQQILFFFIIPMKLKYLALLDVAIVFIFYATTTPLLGIFALLGCAYAYWYVRPGFLQLPERSRQAQVVRVYNKRGLGYYLNPFKWISEYRRTRKLKKLFKDSGYDDGSDR